MLLNKPLKSPPTDGSILLHDTLGFHVQHNPGVPVYLFADDDDDVRLTEISYDDFAWACSRVSQALGTNTDPSDRPVVAVVALSDTFVYQAIVMGIMSAGYIPFPISPRNTSSAIVNLLNATSCHHLVATCSTLKDLINAVQRELDPAHILTITEAPGALDLFPQVFGISVERSPYKAPLFSPKVTINDIALYLHSSGSTGYPKAIPKTHRDILEYVESPCCTVFRSQTERSRVAGMQLPPFHALGVVLQVFLPLFSCVSVVLFHPVVKNADMVPMAMTPENVLKHVQKTKCNGMVAIPAFLKVWASDPVSIGVLRSLDLVMYSGGGLSKKLGDSLVKTGVVLRNIYGGTEVGGPAFSSQRPGDELEWEYVEFSKKCTVNWVPQGDGTYECQLYSSPTHHLSVFNMPGVDGFATADLFAQHPVKEYLWKIVGRLDDVIIHSSGEKTVPPPLEGILLSSPHIMGVAMFGRGHDQAGVLIEPSSAHEINSTDAKQVAKYLSLIWPVIREVNQIAPAYSRIYKEMILITSKHKPLPRAPKGTVIRKLSLRAYSAEIEELYNRFESADASEKANLPHLWNRVSLIDWIYLQVQELCPGKIASISTNLFDHGFDSLSSAILRRRIIGAFKANTDLDEIRIAHNVIYQYPTIEQLADHVLGLTDNSLSTVSLFDGHLEDIEAMAAKYSFSDRVITSKSLERVSVLLTGSTGHLGSEILQGLLRDNRVSKIYTMNRLSSRKGLSIIDRHTERFRDQGLDEKLLEDPRLVHLETDISSENLGLPDSLYAELCNCVTVIIHVAWKLDFNLSLASFEGHVRGTHNLLTLARAAPHASDIKFIFTSSVSTAQSWDNAAGLYPEELVAHGGSAVGLGYGESKYVAERIIASSGLNATSLRIGQISGSKNGAWATSDWVPIMLKTSIALGALPSAHGTVSWLPMDAVASCVLDLVECETRYPAAMNVVHPKSIQWDSVLEMVQNGIHSLHGTRLPLVPFAQWFAMVEGCRTGERFDIENIPGLKLLDFFRHLCDGYLLDENGGASAFGAPEFATAKMEALSQTLANLSPLNSNDIQKWISYWDAHGVLAQ